MTASSEADDGTSPRWGLADAALGLVAGYLLSIVTTIAWLGVSGADADDRSLGVAVAGITGLWLGLGGAVILAARRKGSGSVVEDFGVRVRPRDAFLGLALGVVSQVVIALVYVALRVEEVGEENEQLVDATHGPGLLVLFLLLVLGAPLVEEVFFRGLLQRSLVRRFGPALGIAMSATVFGLTHFDPVAFPGLTAFGVVLGVAAHRTGRLGPSIVAHVLFNAAAVSLYLAG